MGSLYLWSHSIQEMGGDVLIGRSIYGIVVIDGSLCSRFYGICAACTVRVTIFSTGGKFYLVLDFTWLHALTQVTRSWGSA